MYSPLIERALHVALAAHEGQTRKGESTSPYVTHPLHVALMLARFGMEEDVLAAGLLHDVVEDAPGWTIERVAAEFNPHVAAIVAQLTEDKSKSWEERKSAGIAKVPHMSPEAASVKACDKLHNLNSLTASLRARADHDRVWSRFKGGREKTLAMSKDLVDALVLRVDPRIGRALRNALTALHDAAAAPSAS